MFEICMVTGWAAAMILLLLIRAEIRELSGLMKENRRELLRNNMGSRAGESYPNFQEEARRKRTRGGEVEQQPDPEKQSIRLNESEEQILKEVLAEFLG